MNNHIHFLVKANKAQDMPKFFQSLFQRYASYFRKRYEHEGYLFQNRYKSYHINKDSYLLECARYIERNPVRANIVMDPGSYKWSSYACYSKSNKDAIIKELNPLYLSMAASNAERQERYKSYLLEERPYEHIVDKGLRIQ
jgi:putative transposase